MPLDEGIVNSLPEDIRKEPSFAEIQKSDLPGVFKNLIDSQKTLGRAIILPDEKDPEEKRVEKLNSVYEKLGRPKTHAEYDFKDVIKDGEVDPARVEKYQKIFHEAGLSNAQAKRLIAAAMEESAGGLSAESAMQALSQGDEKHTGWGEKIEENIGVAKAALVKFDTDGELLSFLETTKLGNHPVVLRFLHSIGSQLAGDKTPGVESRAGNLDKSSAQSKLAEIMSNKAHPYFDRKSPGYTQAQAEVKRLHEVIYGDEVVAELGTH